MADPAPLTSAHAHARKAAEETQQIHWHEAANEHELAASDFARAARSTSEPEALRVLKLLEEQHAKLAQIIKVQEVSEPGEPSIVEAKQPHDAASQHDLAPSAAVRAEATTRPQATTTALPAARFGSSARDSSPSLARDIASRRGIPQPRANPPSAAAQARARQLSPESHRRNRSNANPKIPPSIVDSQALKSTAKTGQTSEDDAFAKFYSNLTTGTMSKLSSVLAFAGLPLTAEDAQAEQDRQRQNKKTVSASNDPDVKKIFSKAALEAIEDEHRQRGTQGHVFGPAESFYVVQKGGGTYSYADIVKPPQHLLGIDEDDEDAFVDAREAQGSVSPQTSRFPGHNRSVFGKSKTQEEVELENVQMKATLEQLIARITEFESHAQDASMAAITQSMASLPNRRPMDGSDQERIRQLEIQLEQATEEQQRLQNTNAKQEKTLKQYRSKWEDLKKNAKEKERAKREKLADNTAASTAEAS